MQYNLSTDFEALYDAVMAGARILGFAAYDGSSLRDAVVITKHKYDNGITIGCRGIAYGGVEANARRIDFVYGCERIKLEYIPMPDRQESTIQPNAGQAASNESGWQPIETAPRETVVEMQELSKTGLPKQIVCAIAQAVVLNSKKFGTKQAQLNASVLMIEGARIALQHTITPKAAQSGE